MRTCKGFTLIELVIVVVIIGILAAIGIPNFILMQNRAREANVKCNGHACQMAVEDYSAQNGGAYPPAGTAAADIAGNMPGGIIFTNPFNGGAGLSVNVGPIEGMVDYIDSITLGIPNSYRINCYGLSAIGILVINNG
ncbi:MAG: prepilin-type N-terminal cleavage/methylation domain-containing protein [bacterium]|nr:prepilin-type N-terminal cleavage/methylation domain-containing protein [bacterium]